MGIRNHAMMKFAIIYKNTVQIRKVTKP